MKGNLQLGDVIQYTGPTQGPIGSQGCIIKGEYILIRVLTNTNYPNHKNWNVAPNHQRFIAAADDLSDLERILYGIPRI